MLPDWKVWPKDVYKRQTYLRRVWKKTVPTSLKSKLPLPHRTAYRYVPAILPTQKSSWTVPRKDVYKRQVFV